MRIARKVLEPIRHMLRPEEAGDYFREAFEAARDEVAGAFAARAREEARLRPAPEGA